MVFTALPGNTNMYQLQLPRPEDPHGRWFVVDDSGGMCLPEISSQQVALCRLGSFHNSSEGPLPHGDIGLRYPIRKTKGKQGMGDTGLSASTVALMHGRNHGAGECCH